MHHKAAPMTATPVMPTRRRKRLGVAALASLPSSGRDPDKLDYRVDSGLPGYGLGVLSPGIVAAAINLRGCPSGSPGERPGYAGPGGPMDIKHVVVLMLENRSFDCMLGMLYPSDDKFDGLTGTESKYLAQAGWLAAEHPGLEGPGARCQDRLHPGSRSW